jgi:signal transduction histidine kinase/DNA-binding NarL/FixJ family response regulator
VSLAPRSRLPVPPEVEGFELNSSAFRILLVEDGPGDARLIRELLKAVGFDLVVEEVATAAAAVSRLEDRAVAPVDVVLLDLTLPDSHGIDTVDRVVKVARDAAVVVLTGFAAEWIGSEAVAAGAQDFLQKGEFDERLLARSIRYAAERKNRERERRQSEERAWLVAEAGALFTRSLDLHQTLRSVGGFITAHLADHCVIELVGDEGEPQTIDVSTADPAAEPLLRAKVERFPYTSHSQEHPAARALATGVPAAATLLGPDAVESVAREEEHLQLLQELGIHSWLALPLTGHGQALGVMVLSRSHGSPPFHPSERIVAEEIAERASVAMENATLFRLSREARIRVEGLQLVTAALARSTTTADVGRFLAAEARRVIGASCALLVLLPEEDEPVAPFAEGLLAELADELRHVASRGRRTRGRVLRDPRSSWLGSREEVFEQFPDLLRYLDVSGARSLAVVPVTVRGEVAAVTVFAFDEERVLQSADRELLETIARQCSLALERTWLLESERRAVRLRDEVLGVVAHDLRNPLGAISMYAQLLEEATAEGRAKGQLGSILRLTEQMDRLIQDLLDVSQIEAGQLRLDRRPVAAAELVEPVASMFGVTAAERGIRLELRVPTQGLPAVEADRSRVVQVFSNLVGNAIKFTRPGGQVAVSAEVVDSSVLFTVRDSGIGIGEEELPRVFDRFWQSRTAKKGGAGLGLGIAKAIVEAHGGTIWAESRVGEGSAFRFSLPIAVATEVTRPEIGEPEPDCSPARGLRVLIVDDHPAIRAGVGELLRQSSTVEVVGEAGTGVSALELVERLAPDVVLMDLEMPGMDGVEATRAILRKSPETRVVVLTGNAPEECLVAVLDAGAVGLVRKADAHAELLPALEIVAKEGVALPRGGGEILVRAFRQSASPEADPFGEMSTQDREILRLVAEGFSSREIGRKLYLASSTVDSYRSDLMRRLAVGHRSELVKLALRHGLLAQPGELPRQAEWSRRR